MTRPATELAHLNACDRDSFIAALGGIFENAPWVAERAFSVRPFATVAALHDGMTRTVAAAAEAEQLDLIRGHPELGSRVARAGAMTELSRQEQGSLGLDGLSEDEFALIGFRQALAVIDEIDRADRRRLVRAQGPAQFVPA